MDLKAYSHWVEMELLHLKVSAAFLDSYNHAKKRFMSNQKQVSHLQLEYTLNYVTNENLCFKYKACVLVEAVFVIYFYMFYLINWLKK